MRRWMAVAVVALVAAGCGSSGSDEADTPSTEAPTTEAVGDTPATDAETTTTVAETTTTEAPAEPLVFSAAGEQQTAPVQVAAGNYSVHYKFDGPCYYSGQLEPTDPDSFEMLDAGTGSGPVEGDTNLYNVEGGEYFVGMITGPAPGCPWTVTLTPQG